MNCRSCGANLPPGATICPVCNNPTPYNVPAPGSYDPTVLAPNYGTPDGSNNQQQYDPTVVAPQYGTPGTPPAQGYGASSYGTPPPPYQAPQDPYNQYPATQYVAPPPPNQFGGVPPAPQGGYIPPPGYGMQPPSAKPRSRIGLILGIVGGVVVLACVALGLIGYLANKSSFTSVKGPSGLSTDSTAAGYVTNPQTAAGVDSNRKPVNPTTTFTVGQQIYATFEIDSSSPDGYIQGKWYLNNTLQLTSRILHSTGGSGTGYFSASSNTAAPGTIELYWCQQSNCSDAKLADILNFTVTSTGIHWTGQPALASMDINKREM